MYSDGSSNSRDLKTKLIILPIFKISSVSPTSPLKEMCPVQSLPTATVLFAQTTNAMTTITSAATVLWVSTRYLAQSTLKSPATLDATTHAL